MAAKLQVKSEGQKLGSGAGQGTVKFGLAHHVRYELAGLSFHSDSYIVDLSSQPALLGRYIGGILGYDFFARYVVDVDYEARVVTLYNSESYPPIGRALPFTLIKHVPYIRVGLAINGRAAAEREVMVDTGSQDAIDDNLFADSTDRVEVIGGVGLGQEFRVTLGRADALLLGEFTVPRPIGATGGKGLIGNEVLRRFHVAFDYPHNRIFFSPGRHLLDTFPMDASGLDLRCDSTSGTFLIHDVAKASPASTMDLRVGDFITAINGQAASAFEIDQVASLLCQNGRTLWLTIKRGSGSHTVRLTLRRRM